MGSLAFVAAHEAPEPGDPLQTTFDDVAVPAEPGRGLDALAGDAGLDPALGQGLAAGPVVVALVAVQLRRPFPGPADRLAHRRDAVDHILQDLVIVDVGSRDVGMQRKPVPITDRVNLGTGLASVYRARPGQVPPLTARTCIASTLALDQSICPAAPSTSSIASCNARITPAWTHSVNRR